jgi:hypothetical protein
MLPLIKIMEPILLLLGVYIHKLCVTKLNVVRLLYILFLN